jgi:hypothetical protein
MEVQRHMKYLVNVFLLLLLGVSGSHVLAFGNMSADEVRTLVTGNSAEGDRREGARLGSGPSNALENYAEGFVIFFAKKGIVKYKAGDKRNKGKWHVTDGGKLCLKWKGEKEGCAPVHKEGKVYKRATINKIGRVLWEFEFIRFTPGNEYNL